MNVGSLLSSLPTLGPFAVFLVILVYLARLLITADKRHEAELRRVNAAHDEELRELRDDIQALRTEISGLRDELKQEREARRRAEEDAHRLRLNRGDDTHAV